VTTRVLVAEDDPTVAEVVAMYLRRDGHEVEWVADGVTALNRARSAPPDLVILDVLLPGLDGLGEETDRVAGLELGADDYVTKPFSPRELALRVRSVLRRAAGALAPGDGVLRDGDLVVDLAAHQATLAGTLLRLTVREFDLLAFLMRNPRQVFAKRQLLEHVWGWAFGDVSTVTVHVRRLREKVEDDPVAPRRILTVWGVGYRYEAEGAR